MCARWGCARAALLVVFFSTAASAQVIPPSEQPGRERERFIEPRAPLAQPGGPAIMLPSTAAPSGAAQIKLTISDVCFHGSTIYRKEDFAPLYQGLLGHEITLQDIYDLAKQVTAKYGADGYALTRAVVAPQKFAPHGAVPCITIVEGYIDKVEWPTSLARYRDFFTHYAAQITAERPVNVRTIERYLLLASDLPGLKFSASMKPSKTHPGASTLVVEVTEKPLDLLGRVDNRGTQARGPVQVMASATVNNLLKVHESLNVTWAATTQLKELEYFAAGYRQVLTAEGLWAFVNASYGFGKPGTAQLELLEYKTKSTVLEAGLASPFIRSRERNLTITGLVFASNSDSDIFSSAFQVDRLRGARFKLDGDVADRLLGVNQFSLAFSQGLSGLGSTGNDNPIPSRTAGRVDFTKVEASISRTQPLFDRFSAFGSVYGQYGFTSLLTPEQCGYGGRFYGRAFDPSQLLGDRCFETVGELRYDLPSFVSLLTHAQLFGFADYGKVWTIAPAVGTDASNDAASVGGGVRFGLLNYFNADLSVAKAVSGPRDDTRFFFVLTGRN